MRWKIKRFTNDELRQKFIDFTVPQAEFLGLTMPDPELRWDETRSGTSSAPIDWSEFERVLKGNGPCNRERLEARRGARARPLGARGGRGARRQATPPRRELRGLTRSPSHVSRK